MINFFVSNNTYDLIIFIILGTFLKQSSQYKNRNYDSVLLNIISSFYSGKPGKASEVIPLKLAAGTIVPFANKS